MVAPGVGARPSGRLGFLSTLFLFVWFLPTGSGFKITSIGSFAQCAPTLVTWDIGQSLPPFTVSISITSNPDNSLTFTGFEGTSATVTLNLPAKTLVNIALVNSGGVLDQASNIVIQPGTDSGCANSAFGGHAPLVASTVPDLPGFSTDTSGSSTSTDTTIPLSTSASTIHLASTDHSFSSSATDSTSLVTAPISVTSTHTRKPHTKPSVPTVVSKSTPRAPVTPAPFSLSNFLPPTSSFVSPSPSSLNSSTPGKGLQPGVIGAIVLCSILGFALGLWLLFWYKRKRQGQRETRHTRLPSPEPREVSLRDSISVMTADDLRPPSILARGPNSPTSVNATIGLPSAEAIMEHRNKPLPTPDTLSWKARADFASSPGAISSEQPMASPRFPTPTPTSITMVGHPRWLARRMQGLGTPASDSMFDDTSSNASTAPPPYDVYE